MSFGLNRQELTLSQKLWQVNWGIVLLLTALACVGFAMLYSAAGGSLEPWAQRQMVRFAMGFVLMIAVALVDIRFWMRWAYVLYAATMVMLVAVELQGRVGMGAQRWLDFGFVQLQPSELMKIMLVLALAKHFHSIPLERMGRISAWGPAAVLLALPVALVVKQPDLGTSLMLIMGSAAVGFIAGMRWWKFALAIATGAAAAPIGWNFLRDYQKERILTFLDPSRDPLGAGYHITQSKIALGSGGVVGKGFMLGTQSHLNFLPEKQTDFIYTMLAEEFGMIGAVTLLGLYTLLILYGYAIAFRSTTQFGRLVAVGIVTHLFLSVFINCAMVMGMIPAKGVPLPMVSYGGSSMLVTMLGFGLLMMVWVHRDTQLNRGGLADSD
ncbi:rod shape-determining protein RodA [Elstera cyanobacteriorum]|uniref:Peptidoglycan glycosyltransferase MrdB n=1 Tax=Elstera cyanobacteriorum TaxID=2022747 RepID=A0A255XSU0_9PROT|nr:rod shape-determining protein RodA [Elstera cyanobacteriorum]MCK6442681.1 rod shape-determining protein RodA [Elstera cyanobacteriorum]OYQ19320.1 rod shape-determining protein RodA [Elstera cyanobacteriorum]GFZ90657.1 rod shape-determining protein RodA [Elstera cyanobacteriorum]